MQQTPKLVQSLMHKKVVKISSGGVHNSCIVEPSSGGLLEQVYNHFMTNQFTDVVFKGFFNTQPESSDGSPDEFANTESDDDNQACETPNSEVNQGHRGSPPKNQQKSKSKLKLRKNFWKPGSEVKSNLKLEAHMCVLAAKSPTLAAML